MEAVVKIVLATIMAILLHFIMALPIMLLWNCLVPTIFGLIEISYWQALGLSVLCNLLFRRIVSLKFN